jgi:hypothetical protein
MSREAIAENVKLTSSFDSLMRLLTLEECIDDAIATQDSLASRINAVLKTNDVLLSSPGDIDRAEQSLESIKESAQNERKLIQAATKKRAELQKGLKERREALDSGHIAHDKTASYLDGAESKLRECRVLSDMTGKKMSGQRRRICQDLLKIYPIEPVSLAFHLNFTSANHVDVRSHISRSRLQSIIWHCQTPTLTLVMKRPLQQHLAMLLKSFTSSPFIFQSQYLIQSSLTGVPLTSKILYQP